MHIFFFCLLIRFYNILFLKKILKFRFSTTENKLSIVFFNSNFEPVSEHKLKDGNLVQSIKAAKYGDHIVVAYSTTEDPGSPFLPGGI